ncbi:zinc-binding dehydrogenase [Streptomyces sp. SAS_272]|uniref:zinc-binding dehydrogenase n=1 Tax=Streptomyces sp. SAS_272 TaxID=3412747 RepID=UPI00403C1805
MPGVRDALPDRPAAGTRSRLVVEAAGEGAQAHSDVRGEAGQGERLAQPPQDPGPGVRRARRARLGDRLFDVPGLAAVPQGRDDTPAGHLADADRAGMREIARPVEAGRLRATIAGTFPPADAAEAHRLGDTGRTTGKPVLTVG